MAGSLAKVGEESISEIFMSGPDLRPQLIGILIQLRDVYFAVMEEIKSMFHQNHVAEEHINFCASYGGRTN